MKKNKAPAPEELQWRVHLPDIFKEIAHNPGMNDSQIRIPLQIIKNILAEVAQRAIELNDPKLHSLMIRLTLYDDADPYSPDYNAEKCRKVLESVSSS